MDGYGQQNDGLPLLAVLDELSCRTMQRQELVVARVDEDLAWLRRVPKAVRVTVYNKGEGEGGIRLPNVGHEAHTYLHHIFTRYDDLADVTVFCQGKPFDHVPDLHRILRRLVAGELRVESFLWLGFIIDRDDVDGTLFRRWGGRSHLPMDAFWRSLFDAPPPIEFVFYPSAHFIVSRDQVRRRSRDFYQRALELSASLPDAAHCFERCWDRVFGADGVPPPFRQGRYPVYLKPIKRLGLTHADVPRAGPPPTWM